MSKLNETILLQKEPQLIQIAFGIERSNTYVLCDRNHAIVVDACSASIVDILKNRGIIPDYLLLTHEHCDHLWGVNDLRLAYPELKVVSQVLCSKAIVDPRLNKAREYHIYAVLRFGSDYHNEEAKNRNFRCSGADIVFDKELKMSWHGFDIICHHSPGHSPGSMLIEIDDIGVFSGDTILQESTFFQFDGGDVQAFETGTLSLIRKIRKGSTILPGHGNAFLVDNWERRSSVK